MPHADTNRMLSAILFTDIAGYTAIMQRDEKAALAWLKRHREVIEQTVSRHNGEIYQFYGDGCLMTFQSATEAVDCALEMQKQFLKEPVIPIRMGVHLGEIFWEGGKIYGDGVNLASRIQSLGQPGTVFFSRDVYLRIRNHREFQAESLGLFDLKNVDFPMEVFALTNEGIIRPDKKKLKGLSKSTARSSVIKRASIFAGILLLVLALLYSFFPDLRPQFGENNRQWEDKVSIAVLPFNNMSEETEDYLATGIAEDILTQLSKIEGLKVISRASTARYASIGKQSLHSVARELGVSNLLQGSVRKQQDQVRISVQLVDPESESYIWAENFDREITDILIVQREVAMAVAEALKVKLSPELLGRLDKIGDVDKDAYLNYQRGQHMIKNSTGTQVELDSAEQFFRRAIEEDPDFTLAYVGLADLYLEQLFWHRVKEKDVLPKVNEVAKKALKLDPELGEIYGILGATMMSENPREAEKNLRKAIALSPSYTPGYERLAWIAIYKGNFDEFVRMKERVLQLDPLSTRYIGAFSYGHFMFRQYDKGIQEMKEYLKIAPEDNFLLWALGHLYVGKKDFKNAIKTFESRTIGTHTNWMLGYAYARSGNREKAEEILQYHLEKAKTGHVPLFMIAVQYYGLGNLDKMYEYLNKSIRDGSEWWFLWMLPHDPMFEPLHGDPRFEKLLDKVRYGNSTI